jgi:hypothetical protein
MWIDTGTYAEPMLRVCFIVLEANARHATTGQQLQ